MKYSMLLTCGVSVLLFIVAAKGRENKDIVETLKCVKWNFVSSKMLVGFAKRSNLRKISLFKESIKSQINKRSLNSASAFPNEMNPRKCYKCFIKEEPVSMIEDISKYLIDGDVNSDDEINLDETVVANTIVVEDISLNAEIFKSTSKYFGASSPPQVNNKELPTVATSEDSSSTMSKPSKDDQSEYTDILLKRLMDMPGISEATDNKSSTMLHDFVSSSNRIRTPENRMKNKIMSKTAMSISVQPSPTAFKSTMKSTFSTKSNHKPVLDKRSPGNRSNFEINYESVTSTHTANDSLSQSPGVKIPKKQDYLRTYKLQNNPLKLLKRFEVSAKHKKDLV